MTREEAKAEQDRIAEHFNLGWWYGTKCKPCCGVYPKIRTSDGFDARWQCRAPDCNHMGPLWTCPWRKKMEADNGEAKQR